MSPSPKKGDITVTQRLVIALAAFIYFTLPSGAKGQTAENPPKTQDSLAEIARKNRSKDTQISTKRAWTDDDFSPANQSSADGKRTPKSTGSESLREFRSLDKEALGKAVLRAANAPDANFADRRNWEQRLFDAKQAWLDQVDRMVGHEDSSKDAKDEEIRLAQAAQRNFERIADKGIQQARAVNDPTLKIHLEYQRQLDFCKQTTGDLLRKCLASADQLKLQMQREGTW
jgi:hypothetical protein